MKKLVFTILLSPFMVLAHPGVGIVKDSKGNIYYTDLKQVWKIAHGNKTVAVPDVHTHELYIDDNDNLYGEGGYYDDKAVRFYHYLWVYRPTGQIDTVLGMKEAYVSADFALAKDRKGNEYYLKRFLVPHTDTTHIYRRSAGGKETIWATGQFKAVNWLHPQDDGSLLYALKNAIYRIDTSGKIELVKDGVGNVKPLFRFSGNNIMIWGLWEDKAKNVYAAVFSDQTVRKIDAAGNISDIYKSKGNWAPLHGVFDNDNRLWVLESSDKNDVRVTMAGTPPVAIGKTVKAGVPRVPVLIISCVVLAVVIFYVRLKKSGSAT